MGTLLVKTKISTGTGLRNGGFLAETGRSVPHRNVARIVAPRIYSTFNPAAATTLAHFASSLRTNAAY